MTYSDSAGQGHRGEVLAMKRTIAAVLTLVLAFGMAVPALAADGMLPDDGSVWEPDMPQDMPSDDMTWEVPGTEEPPVVETPVPTAEPTAVPEPAPEETVTPEPEATDVPAVEDSASDTVTPEETAEPSPSSEPSPSPEAEEDIPMVVSAAQPGLGQVDVKITMAVDTGEWTPAFAVSLKNESDTFFGLVPVTADGEVGSVTGVPAGTYTLTAVGQGCATYTQSVELAAGDGVLLELMVGVVTGYSPDRHPGLIQLGDVDGDGDVDQNDKDVMMKAVAGEAGNGYTDLNGDGSTDLADAEFLAKNERIAAMDPAMKVSTPAHFVPAAAFAMEATADVFAGTKEDLFLDNGSVFTIGNSEDKPISREAPVSLTLDLAQQDGTATADVITLEKTNIASGYIDVELADGTLTSYAIGSAEPVAAAAAISMDMPAPIAAGQASMDAGGNITVDLNGKVAVKKVTIRITGTNGGGSLASISQVEFVNGMESRIPAPQTSIPQGVTAAAGSRQFTVKWNPCENITGYEVFVSNGDVSDTYTVTGTSLTVTNFGGTGTNLGAKEVENYKTYTVTVRSVNGKWKSDMSAAVTVTPKPTGRPDKPDNVKAVGGYQMITVTWKNMKDTQSYNLYYKTPEETEYHKLEGLTGTKYEFTGLAGAAQTEYEVYVTGVNEFGESGESLHASAKTITLDPAEMPRFNLINADESGMPGTNHITSAVLGCGGDNMFDSPLDTAPGSAWGTVDGDPRSYYERGTWNDGGYYNLPANVGLIYTFDQPYEMDTIGMVSTDASMDYTYCRVRWWDESGAEHLYDESFMTSQRRTDSQGRTYFFLRMPSPITATKVQIGVARYWAGNNRVNVADVYFYHYDDLKRQLYGMYDDDLHTTLKSTVTKEQLESLKTAIENSVDKFGNVNPDKDLLLKEWETAWKIFNDQFLRKVTYVHTGITASGDEHGFGGLNAWQPLGVTAAAGEKITVYVSSSLKKTGDATQLKLVATQYHAEASALSQILTSNLKIGANEIIVPKVWTNTGMESGGALYVQYMGGAGSREQYAVRVSGGVQVPVLDLYGVTDPGERSARVSAYVGELNAYVGSMESLHAQVHQAAEEPNAEVNYEYSERNCILGATDIMLDTMMLSLPAKQVINGCGGNAGTLLNSLNAMESMMYLFYQHKGLNASARDAVDRIPFRHLNIRYQRMFSGAFMYASGDHIGIEWPETAGMANCVGITADANGKYVSGNYFGWGVAHEIGHDINQGSYAIAEITNNYFAVLAQAKESNDSVRFDYNNVYAKVTSGAKGSASNVFTQLAMYWQLHLAYDKGYNFRTYSDYNEQLANLFWARVDTYARTPSKAPGGNLSLEGADIDQTLMRLACAAAEKNILDFFVRWGKIPDEATIAYASQLPAETRAIYYANDDARLYALNGAGSALAADGTTAAIASVDVQADQIQRNRVTVTVTPSGAIPESDILGYEIVRRTIERGVTERRTVGFTTTNSFTDVVSAMNNRTVSYEVTLVDKYLNRSAVAEGAMVKVEHGGDLGKDSWTVRTAGLEAAPITSGGVSADDPEVVEENAALYAIDNKAETIYTAGMAGAGAIEIDFHDTHVVTALRYTNAALDHCEIAVRQAGQWIDAAAGTLNGDGIIYFSNGDQSYVSTYAADAIRLVLMSENTTVSVAELDVLGPTGDNVDVHTAGGQLSVGYLEAAYTYDEKQDLSIPRDSLVFTGSYKGNAAYNVVMLYDENGEVVTGVDPQTGERVSHQVILSKVPDSGKIQDVTDGVWVWWIEPEEMDIGKGFKVPGRVRVELYRVNDAMTNEGERLVSDSLFVDVPKDLGSITLGGAD